MNMLTHACRGPSLPHTVGAGRDASLGSPWDLHGSTRKSGAADPAQSLVMKRECISYGSEAFPPVSAEGELSVCGQLGGGVGLRKHWRNTQGSIDSNPRGSD